MRFLILLLFFSAVAQAQDLVNAVALKNGARILSSAPSYKVSSPVTAKIDDYSVQAMIDETAMVWCSQANHTSHLTFLFELSEEYNLEKFVFNTTCENFPGISTKKVRVDLSNVSSSAGFQLAGEYTLDENTLNVVTIESTKARWIKLTIVSNFGNKEYTELAEFEAWGKFSDPSFKETDVVGVWDTNFEWVSINSNKNGYIYGCYKWATGSLYGGVIDRRVFTFTWTQKDNGHKGWCRLVINKEGNRLNGVWGYENDYKQFGFWEFTKNSNTPKNCWNDQEVENRPTNRLEQKPMEVSPAKEIAPLKNSSVLQVIFHLQDKETHSPVKGQMNIHFNGEERKLTADENGIARIELPKESTMDVQVDAPTYMPYASGVSFTDEERNSGKELHKSILLQKVEAGKTILLNNILFERSKYDLLPESHPELDKLAQLMRSNPGMKIELGGHTDNVGDASLNKELSENRVKAVKKYLISKGIHADRIESVGYGGSKPLYSNAQEETRKLNRRVEFKVLKME